MRAAARIAFSTAHGTDPQGRRPVPDLRAMQVRFDSQPGSATKPNEDFVAASPYVLVLLDGLSAPSELGTGCHHGTPWYVAHLGCHLLRLASASTERPLAAVLEEAIATIAETHAECDLAHPGTPSSSVVILRQEKEEWTYLALFDSTIVADTDGGEVVVTDNRVLQFAGEEREETTKHMIGSPGHAAAVRELVAAERQHRNRDGGYWVAGARPEAAAQALTGTLSGRRLAAMTDGVSCLVDMYSLETWPSLFELLESHGPSAAISRTRSAEDSDPQGDRWPRYKHSDDASIAWCMRS